MHRRRDRTDVSSVKLAKANFVVNANNGRQVLVMDGPCYFCSKYHSLVGHLKEKLWIPKYMMESGSGSISFNLC